MCKISHKLEGGLVQLGHDGDLNRFTKVFGAEPMLESVFNFLCVRYLMN